MQDDAQTIKDIILQMLLSPEWQNQYNSFVEENCALFNDDEENQMHLLQIFKNFQKEMANVYDSFFEQLGLNNCDQLQSMVIQDMLQKNDAPCDIDQIIALGDFEVFKAEMAYQNKLREIQAFKQLEDEIESEEEEQLQYDTLKLKLEYEQLEEDLNLQIAVQLSMDQPDEEQIQKLQQSIKLVQERLQLLQIEGQQEEELSLKERLRNQMNKMPKINNQQEREIQDQIKKGE